MIRTLCFPLKRKNDWPPAETESLPFQEREDGFELLSAPLFVPDLSVGDVIKPVLDGYDVKKWEYVSKSRNSTIWLLRLTSPNRLIQVLKLLRNLGCNTETLDAMGVYAIDVPAEISIVDVDRLLDLLDPKTVAVASPSLRHSEP